MRIQLVEEEASSGRESPPTLFKCIKWNKLTSWKGFCSRLVACRHLRVFCNVMKYGSLGPKDLSPSPPQWDPFSFVILFVKDD